MKSYEANGRKELERTVHPKNKTFLFIEPQQEKRKSIFLCQYCPYNEKQIVTVRVYLSLSNVSHMSHSVLKGQFKNSKTFIIYSRCSKPAMTFFCGKQKKIF